MTTTSEDSATGFEMDITSLLIRRGDTTLVRVDRDWGGPDRWRLEPHAATKGIVPMTVVDGYVEAQSTAGRMAVDVWDYLESTAAVRTSLAEKWPTDSLGRPLRKSEDSAVSTP